MYWHVPVFPDPLLAYNNDDVTSYLYLPPLSTEIIGSSSGSITRRAHFLILGQENLFKVAGHPVRSAACLCVESEWEIATWICFYHQDLWQKLCPKFQQTQVWDCPETSLADSS